MWLMHTIQGTIQVSAKQAYAGISRSSKNGTSFLHRVGSEEMLRGELPLIFKITFISSGALCPEWFLEELKEAAS